ncbi:hypothetical protein DW701_04010 [Bacteroides eggerthii]|uniref:Transmembrane protein n=2 Tax=Bacteroides eggerthii TaxID=28111 RepID=A0A415RYC7_9BACE|nr:hypothetical protein BACEGG_00318 [Bacteroides eggerthii DSM 20697]EFV30185.1 hypothetical protein HMPREF1016_01713 [Bacteroides eggerthii 1_2_48FAA]KAA5277302.1 hypothetical protein F2Z23_00570 [Bacteroides eggerthii]KAA5284316.1 hypothetical protein F2Z10_13160 [Bacteroides eggerthii]MBT9882463.1 hypothetical protein [Bacteroides eggerthii]
MFSVTKEFIFRQSAPKVCYIFFCPCYIIVPVFPECAIILFLARKVIIRIFIGEKMANFAPCRSKMREIIYKINY